MIKTKYIKEISCATKLQEIYLLLDWQGYSYIGGKKNTSNTWRWYGKETGEITLDWWADREPSGDGRCLNYYGLSHKFNDVPCDKYDQKFFCERENNYRNNS